MPEQRTSVSLMTVLGVLFTLIALVALVALLRLKSLADTTVSPTQTVSPEANAPSILTLVASDADAGSQITDFTTSEGVPTTLYVYGTARDMNGCEDFSTIRIVAYRSGATGTTDCTADKNDCYAITLDENDWTASCVGGGTDTDIEFETTFAIDYFADPTIAGSPYVAQNWIVYALPTEDSETEGTPDSVTFEMNTLAAFSVAENVSGLAAINYGTIPLGGYSSEVDVKFTNLGNIAVDSQLYSSAAGAPYSCSDGDMCESSHNFNVIPAVNVKFALSTGFDYDTTTDTVVKTSGSPALIAINMAQQTNDTSPETDHAFFKLKLPTVNISGTYSNVLNFIAVAH